MAAKWYCSRYSNNCVRGFDRALLEASFSVMITKTCWILWEKLVALSSYLLMNGRFLHESPSNSEFIWWASTFGKMVNRNLSLWQIIRHFPSFLSIVLILFLSPFQSFFSFHSLALNYVYKAKTPTGLGLSPISYIRKIILPFVQANNSNNTQHFCLCFSLFLFRLDQIEI